MSVAALKYISPEEYLTIERAAPTKSEYINGVMYALAGASREHILIVGSCGRELGNQLRNKPCEVYSADMRVNVRSKGLYTYPDIAVVRGQPEFIDSQVDTLLNPTVIIEVLSPSTAGYDIGAKWEYYRAVSSLQEYLLIWQDRPRFKDTRSNPKAGGC